MIELINFTKHYGDLVAVDCLNLKIAAGEMFGFIGPNGAGKSTSIRFLATLLKATGGEGIVNGHSVTREPLEVRRSVGYMPDSFGVYDGMKVWEFLDFFAVAYQIPRTRRKQVIGDVLELLDLTGKRDSFVNGLSRGMKQRLCLAKTLVHDPPVLILDEPASGLDPRARLEVKALLKELRQMGKTILISSHILTELADCCALPEAKQVHVNGNSLTAELAIDDRQTAALLEQLLAQGVRMRSFAEKEPTLEDVFMLVTKGAVG
jgi:ABC-2 type transport system ATP-binding protein